MDHEQSISWVVQGRILDSGRKQSSFLTVSHARTHARLLALKRFRGRPLLPLQIASFIKLAGFLDQLQNCNSQLAGDTFEAC